VGGHPAEQQYRGGERERDSRLHEIPRSVCRSRRLAMIQQGQVLKLKTKGPVAAQEVE
jgi:hypothetical protein